ncbi:acetyl-CoA hydrolase/transferase family protein [Nocardia uniformis]|uniref:Acetyl-CoA hydrolase/transferase family protein n=1 Tax=Nocardia uniformis TaxID=53432 RepID=A0A849BZ84_9NOCA|nr:acetyl-CoA hydrolase/transferase C-terminal domain-containing protein [Nocardia uniformis]NNH70456.1 acetyl-CoA hydrolase/transferase family protein [Nocardia uniformis]
MAVDIDLREFIHPGDFVVWGQACAEPAPLVERLLAQRAELGHVTCFLGIPVADTVKPEHADHIRFIGYCGSGSNRALVAAGVLEVYPGHYSTLPAYVSRADVVLVQCAPPDAQGRYRIALADDYLTSAVDSARTVIAEVNDQAPATPGARYLTADRIDLMVHTSRPVAQNFSSPDASELPAIGGHIAALVPDGATLQFGIGSVPEAVLGALGDHNDLGIHSGILTDAAVELIDKGVVTNRRKSTDPGVSVAAVLIGTRRLFDHVHGNPAVSLRPITYTHDPERLAAHHAFVAINSAIEVDLTGQVNAEVAGGRYVGAVGGGAEFLRGAARSAGGVPIIALPATAGPRSRIVDRLSGPVSTARSDVGVVVTEFGVADLRGLTLPERRRAMVAIAHPDHRELLQDREIR